MKMQLGWLKEYSTINRENHIFKIVGKNVNNYSHSSYLNNSVGVKTKKMEITALRRRTVNEAEIFRNSIFLKLNEENILFENENFNIFDFEKKVGKENILPAISVYVFNYKELFEIIPYEKFEHFVYEISKGYHRENPYHTDLHAADMLQSIFLYNIYSKFEETLNLIDLDIISMFVSAIILMAILDLIIII